MSKRRKRQQVPADPLASREGILRTLALGGAGGHYGFGRYPEGIFATVRYMVVVRAVLTAVDNVNSTP